MHYCSMCPYFGPNTSDFMKHLLKRHRNEGNFMVSCNVEGCGATFRNYFSFRNHCQRKHKGDTNFYSTCTATGETEEVENDSFEKATLEEEDRRMDAAFILKLKAGHNLSQAVLSEVLCSTNILFQEKMSHVKASLGLEQSLESTPMKDQDSIDKAFCGVKLFDGLQTEREQESFFRSHFGYIPPVAVSLGEQYVNKKSKGRYIITKKECLGYFVPFLDQLQSLLSMPEVQECLQETTHFRCEDLMYDVLDGAFIQSSKFHQDHPGSLVVFFYNDDFEIVNPIGSHKKKHKVTAFYWGLLNIPPEHRSKLSSIQLLALANAADVKKFGLQKLLQDFTRGLQSLSNGVELVVNGRNELHYGVCLFALADTLAAQSLSGFKEGVGNAFKPCRSCEITKDELRSCFSASDVEQRSEEEHQSRVDILSQLSLKARTYWSKMYGVCGGSVLQEIPQFQLTKCLLHDPMHVLLEGVCRLELRAMLDQFINVKKYFTLKVLERRITHFEYTVTEARDKPQPFEKKHLKKEATPPLSAAAMKNLMCLLPFMIGDLVPEDDPFWQNFIRLLQITLLCLSPVASVHTVNTLEHQIAIHNKSFIELYPEVSVTPKLHYLVHLPEQLKRFGPLRNHWCMRLEGKNGLFKRKRWFNFKNVSKSLAAYHQRWMCLQQCGTLGTRSQNYLYLGDDVKEGYNLPSASFNLEDQIIQEFGTSRGRHPEFVHVSPRVDIRGHVYQPGTVLVKDFVTNSLPEFVQITSIVVLNQSKYFICNRLDIEQFEEHLNAFHVKGSKDISVISSRELKYDWPQICHTIEGRLLVMMQCVDDCWMS